MLYSIASYMARLEPLLSSSQCVSSQLCDKASLISYYFNYYLFNYTSNFDMTRASFHVTSSGKY